jgi:hypothetical protein
VLWEKALAGSNQAGKISNGRAIGIHDVNCNRASIAGDGEMRVVMNEILISPFHRRRPAKSLAFRWENAYVGATIGFGSAADG